MTEVMIQNMIQIWSSDTMFLFESSLKEQVIVQQWLVLIFKDCQTEMTLCNSVVYDIYQTKIHHIMILCCLSFPYWKSPLSLSQCIIMYSMQYHNWSQKGKSWVNILSSYPSVKDARITHNANTQTSKKRCLPICLSSLSLWKLFYSFTFEKDRNDDH